MKKGILFCVTAVLIVTACATKTFDIDQVRERLNVNNCRINREELIFQIRELEYLQDTTFTEIPASLLADSIVICPATGQSYLLVIDGDEQAITCPTHGDSSF